MLVQDEMAKKQPQLMNKFFFFHHYNAHSCHSNISYILSQLLSNYYNKLCATSSPHSFLTSSRRRRENTRLTFQQTLLVAFGWLSASTLIFFGHPRGVAVGSFQLFRVLAHHRGGWEVNPEHPTLGKASRVVLACPQGCCSAQAVLESRYTAAIGFRCGFFVGSSTR